jgi:hypothetical protein
MNVNHNDVDIEDGCAQSSACVWYSALRHRRIKRLTKTNIKNLSNFQCGNKLIKSFQLFEKKHTKLLDDIVENEKLSTKMARKGNFNQKWKSLSIIEVKWNRFLLLFGLSRKKIFSWSSSSTSSSSWMSAISDIWKILFEWSRKCVEIESHRK